MSSETSNHLPEFLSPAPTVQLVNAFQRPFDNAVATARTCYSAKGIVTSAQVAGDDLEESVREEKKAKRDDLARSIYKAGHHTTFQHAHFQFALSNVSRQFLWAFLHSHPYYNSEQVSQRYVTVSPDQVAVPPLSGEALSAYRDTVDFQMDAYRRLTEKLKPLAEAEYRVRFRGADLNPAKTAQAVQKKAQEAARYVLPVATFAYLYHTISGLTLLRYWRMCEAVDVPLEQRLVVGRMLEEVLKIEPGYRALLEGPLERDQTLEMQMWKAVRSDENAKRTFRSEFDRSLGGHTSLLVDWSSRAEVVLADAVREILAIPRDGLSDDEAIAWVLDPSRDPYLGETLNVRAHAKLPRAMCHPHYVFRRKISHTADSQDQRHRMTPASRPLAQALSLDEPDFILPALVEADPEARKIFMETMERSWDGIRRMRAKDVCDEYAGYLIPNAVAVRYTESSDLLNLHHKHAMRLCFNAQEEIWKASVEEAEQIKAIHPRIGRWLLPPCGLRSGAKKQPPCPEGERFCGVPVWKKDLSEYKRLI
jgi:thymidylate synthase ThyX